MNTNVSHKQHTDNCPCGSGKLYHDCCQRFHSGAQYPPSALLLMRSRYCAFVKADIPYLLKTRHASTRSLDNATQLKESCLSTTWLGLDIHRCIKGGINDTSGSVAFTARYLENGRGGTLTETSRFVKEGPQWYYLDGEYDANQSLQSPKQQIGRNEPCWCGSGKKHKRCHG